MIKIRFAKLICAGVALLLAAAGTPAGAGAAPSKFVGARAQKKQGAQAPAGKSGAGAEAKKKGGAVTAAAASSAQVREIDEAGLKALLEEHAKAGRRLLINFWATWCTPCREEFPDLVQIDREFAGLGDFEFVTISSDDVSEIGTTVPAFLSEMRAEAMPAYLLNATDPEAAIAAIDPTWHGDLPATFLFGPDGKILFKHKGRITAGKLRQAIKDSGKTVTSDK